METIKISKSQLRANQKANYWRGFRVGLIIMTIPLIFVTVLLQKIININL